MNYSLKINSKLWIENLNLVFDSAFRKIKKTKMKNIDIITYQQNYNRVLPFNGEVILDKIKFKMSEVNEAEGIEIGKYYYLIYYEFSHHWDREEAENVIDLIDIKQVCRSPIDEGEEYTPVYEFSRLQWEDIMTELINYIFKYEIE